MCEEADESHLVYTVYKCEYKQCICDKFVVRFMLYINEAIQHYSIIFKKGYKPCSNVKELFQISYLLTKCKTFCFDDNNEPF